jgi:hypothetical protein
MTAIPMRFSVLSSDKIDDAEFAEIKLNEFIYNQQDPAYRLISQSLRYPSSMDALGLKKSYWKEQIHKRFNFLSLLNFAFREYIDTCLSMQAHNN